MKSKEEPIFYCTGTTATQIQVLIANNVNTLEAIINETGATTGCAGCEYDVVKFVEQCLNSADVA